MVAPSFAAYDIPGNAAKDNSVIKTSILIFLSLDYGSHPFQVKLTTINCMTIEVMIGWMYCILRFKFFG